MAPSTATASKGITLRTVAMLAALLFAAGAAASAQPPVKKLLEGEKGGEVAPAEAAAPAREAPTAKPEAPVAPVGPVDDFDRLKLRQMVMITGFRHYYFPLVSSTCCRNPQDSSVSIALHTNGNQADFTVLCNRRGVGWAWRCSAQQDRYQ